MNASKPSGFAGSNVVTAQSAGASLPGDFNAGVRRAAARMHRLLLSEELREVIGFSAFDAHLIALTKAEPLEYIQGIIMQQCDDERELEFGGLLNGLRKLPIHRHRFETAAARRRFVNRLHKKDYCAMSWALARVGWLQGPTVLAHVFDDMAQSDKQRKAA
ncbi:hypothetical protein KFK14_05435 [Sphingobium phenoxybenzoativorans]|uniref:Uncharacterized protein n=1 Tax=Sphingobium phenoxybenzoativorans TaxID=1592790 RepID=A0A975Q2N8_9SPHN|nr:hypothetical protein [Sphingobium phenoxybenzoativorans]QUT06881.1 hypothetical protein KFK14_05435 [Sphingobium phenoxybenzoativorans]